MGVVWSDVPVLLRSAYCRSKEILIFFTFFYFFVSQNSLLTRKFLFVWYSICYMVNSCFFFAEKFVFTPISNRTDMTKLDHRGLKPQIPNEMFDMHLFWLRYIYRKIYWADKKFMWGTIAYDTPIYNRCFVMYCTNIKSLQNYNNMYFTRAQWLVPIHVHRFNKSVLRE